MDRIHDKTGTLTCPYCELGEHLSYRPIPSLILSYREGAARITEDWREGRDYRCDNCGITFLMASEEVQGFTAGKP